MRRESAVALTRIASGRPAITETLVEPITERLRHPGPDVRVNAAWVLGELGSARVVALEGRRYRLYPESLDARPDVPSPLTTADGTELVLTLLEAGKYGIVPVTLKASDGQCRADGRDFPTLERTGLHSAVLAGGLRRQ